MQMIRSTDGTAIAVLREGAGPPLVLVHGTTADHTRWSWLMPELTRHFTVLAMDRRGRGQSGDSANYSLDLEYDDVAAVTAAAGPGAMLLGHSYGALLALEAALRVSNLHRLVLYEPAFPVDGQPVYPPGTAERFQALLDKGDRDTLLTVFLRELAGMADDDIAALRAQDFWDRRKTLAHTIARELADGDYVFDPARFAGMTVPTLLLVGENSPPMLTAPSARLAATLPAGRVVVLPGQGHVAMTTSPELFLRAVVSFLTEERSAGTA
jgi:pimeloyl-ACP methyl ester carboxylesterase